MSPEYKAQEQVKAEKGHILVDFDHTLAHYDSWETQGPRLGSPIAVMVERVKRWIAAGWEVRIFTARANFHNPRLYDDTRAIQAWCKAFIGQELKVTNTKDFDTVAIWDNLAVTVEANTGWRWTAINHSDVMDPLSDPVSYEEEQYLIGYSEDETATDVDSPPST